MNKNIINGNVTHLGKFQINESKSKKNDSYINTNFELFIKIK